VRTIRVFFALIIMLSILGCGKRVHMTAEQLNSIRDTVSSSLPSEARVSVTLEHKMGSARLVIWAHLLEGNYADDNSPYVRGDYGTHEKLRKLVMLRCIKIYKVVARRAYIPAELDAVVVRARHGVRQYYGSYSNPRGDFAMTLYSVILPAKDVRDILESTSEESIARRWSVEEDIINRLNIRRVF
jgi:hypothetical protein